MITCLTLFFSCHHIVTIWTDFLSDPVRFFSHRRIDGRNPASVPLPDHPPIRMSHLGRHPNRIPASRQKQTRIGVARLGRVPVAGPGFPENCLGSDEVALSLVEFIDKNLTRKESVHGERKGRRDREKETMGSGREGQSRSSVTERSCRVGRSGRRNRNFSRIDPSVGQTGVGRT